MTCSPGILTSRPVEGGAWVAYSVWQVTSLRRTGRASRFIFEQNIHICTRCLAWVSMKIKSGDGADEAA